MAYVATNSAVCHALQCHAPRGRTSISKAHSLYKTGMTDAAAAPSILVVARAAEALSALVCLYLVLSLPLATEYAPVLVHWYGSALLAAVLAWRLNRPSPATVAVASLFALYTIVRIGMALPGVADAGMGYNSPARILSIGIVSSVAVAQLIVLLSLWRAGWFRREPTR